MNAIGPEEWVQIMPMLPQSDAQAAIMAWIKRASEVGVVIKDGDIREDILKTGERRDLIRFLVRKHTLGEHLLSLVEPGGT